MNKDIKLDWDTVQKCIALADLYGEDGYVIKELKQFTQIKTLDEFMAHPEAPEWLCWHALELRKGRIEAFEDIIATNVREIYMYCIDVAKCRIPAMEKSIAISAKWSCWYCEDIAKHRIPELEAAIKKDSYFWGRYIKLPEEVKQ